MARHQAAVLGKPIAHSLSPLLHNAGYRALGLTQWEYTRIECDEHELPQVVASADASFRGFSVTMPGKFAALAVATDRTDRAQLIGSANTLVRSGDGWRAANTDCAGVTARFSTPPARNSEPPSSLVPAAPPAPPCGRLRNLGYPMSPSLTAVTAARSWPISLPPLASRLISCPMTTLYPPPAQPRT